MQTILDCDPGTDDLSNICLSIAVRDDMLAIIASFGCSALGNTFTNANLILQLCGRTEITVLPGAASPLSRHPVYGDKLPTFFGENGISNVEYPEGFQPEKFLNPALDRSIENILSLLVDAPEKSIEYVVTGPCTTLAQLLAADFEIVTSRLASITIMGGALKLAGNTGAVDSATGQKLAEFNVYLDPAAFNAVLASGLPVTLVTWDEARKFTISRQTVLQLSSELPQSKLLIQAYRNFFTLYGKVHFCDSQDDPYMTQVDVLTTLSRLKFGKTERLIIRASEETPNFGCLIADSRGYSIENFILDSSTRPVDFFLDSLKMKY